MTICIHDSWNVTDKEMFPVVFCDGDLHWCECPIAPAFKKLAKMRDEEERLH
jgi:hypothetical protein